MISGHCSVQANGYMYCIGGWNDGKTTNKVYRLNLNETTLQWEEVASMIEKRYNFGAAAYDGNIVVAGGSDGWSELNTVELHNVQANEWKKNSSMKQHRMNHAVMAVEGTFFAIGGHRNRTAEQLDELNGEWKEIQSMNCKRENLAAVRYNGFIYAIGGLGKDAGRSVEKYDLANGQ